MCDLCALVSMFSASGVVNHSYVKIDCMTETFINVILHIKEIVCFYVLDIIITFTAEVLTSACAAPVYMVLLNVL